ncbi:MAG TPA: type II secretion system protein [Candidatus Fimihabitans intestinipullorum]|uniref:Type II secretion system protein n=1 Tax=Candidatus Fimihabitans intestinipullorum TaxID=2840820 RepID=A0A9D1L4J3_9BACT|nr:type II secretion system protein [Candidatus Fimihabitans intestinipullorum]
MREEKGFTLIELLAVIVILAVIALIATPLIMGVIDDARKGSAKNGAYGYVKALENTIATEMIKDTTISPSAIQTNVGQVMFTKRMNNGNIASAGSRVMNYKGTKPERHNLNIIDGTVGNGSCIVISGYGFQMNHNEWEEINVGECKENSNGNIIVDVKEGMIPVTFDSSGNTVVADTTKEWYNYDEKKWANAVSVTSASRSNYQNTPGTIIDENDILAYFVYVPRYRYQLWNAENGVSNEQTINIEFETSGENKKNGTKNGEWLTHPAFTFGNTELNGIWVGKFELTGAGGAPTTKPNQKSLTNQNISTAWNTIRLFSTNGEYGLTSYDAHMMKNSEWGAVAYLSHSKYGKNGEVWINNVNTGTGVENNGVQWGPSITGCAGTSASVGVKNNMTACEPGRDYKNAGVNASTTGNIYGIYDMSGGVWERVVASVVNQDGTFVSASSGFSSKPESKYYDEYAYNTDLHNFNISKLGDAMKETRKKTSGNNQNWYNDYTLMPGSYSDCTTCVWVDRGGAAGSGSSAGLFGVHRRTGDAWTHGGSRAVVVAG